MTYLSDERGIMSEGSVRKLDTLGDALERLMRMAGAAKRRNEDYCFAAAEGVSGQSFYDTIWTREIEEAGGRIFRDGGHYIY